MRSGPIRLPGTTIFRTEYKDSEAVEMMRSAVEHRYDDLHMLVTDDFILPDAFEPVGNEDKAEP